MRDSEELIRAITGAVIDAGIDLDALTERMRFGVDEMLSISRRSRHRRQVAFWTAVRDVTGDPDVGLRLARHIPLFNGHILQYIYLSSPTFREALQVAPRYHRLISDAYNSRLTEGPTISSIEFLGTSLASPVLQHSEVCYAFGVTQFLRQVTEDEFCPRLVKLPLEGTDKPELYESLFGSKVEFASERSALIFDSKILDRKGVFSGPEIMSVHLAHAERKIEALAAQDLIDSVLETLIGALIDRRAENEMSLAWIADKLSITVRQLRMELAASGTTYRQLLASARAEIAIALLEHSTASTAAIAERVGFAEPRAFRRAFKQWCGQTPSSFRRNNIGGYLSGDVDAVLDRFRTL